MATETTITREGHVTSRIASDCGLDPNAVYVLGTSAHETSRLQRQADELLVANTTLIDRTTLGLGDVAIDLGCGPRGILEVLSDRVGPSGCVVGLDADPNHVSKAVELIYSPAALQC